MLTAELPQGCWPLTASTVPWTPTGVLALDCQRCPLDPHRGAGPSLPTLPALHCQRCPLNPHRGAGPSLPSLSPEPPQGCWPFTASAVPWTPTGVPALRCQRCPLNPHRGAGPWLLLQPNIISCDMCCFCVPSAKAAEEKLRYAAYNCIAIDTDMNPWEGSWEDWTTDTFSPKMAGRFPWHSPPPPPTPHPRCLWQLHGRQQMW